MEIFESVFIIYQSNFRKWVGRRPRNSTVQNPRFIDKSLCHHFPWLKGEAVKFQIFRTGLLVFEWAGLWTAVFLNPPATCLVKNASQFINFVFQDTTYPHVTCSGWCAALLARLNAGIWLYQTYFVEVYLGQAGLIYSTVEDWDTYLVCKYIQLFLFKRETVTIYFMQRPNFIASKNLVSKIPRNLLTTTAEALNN